MGVGEAVMEIKWKRGESQSVLHPPVAEGQMIQNGGGPCRGTYQWGHFCVAVELLAEQGQERGFAQRNEDSSICSFSCSQECPGPD